MTHQHAKLKSNIFVCAGYSRITTLYIFSYNLDIKCLCADKIYQNNGDTGINDSQASLGSGMYLAFLPGKIHLLAINSTIKSKSKSIKCIIDKDPSYV